MKEDIFRRSRRPQLCTAGTMCWIKIRNQTMNSRDHSLHVLFYAMSVGDLTLLMLTDRQEEGGGGGGGIRHRSRKLLLLLAAVAAAGTTDKTQEVRNKRRHWQADRGAKPP